MTGETDPADVLAKRLRELHAIKTRHFTAPDGVQAFSIVATADRLEDANRQAAADFRERLRSVLSSEAASRANDTQAAMALAAVADRMGVML